LVLGLLQGRRGGATARPQRREELKVLPPPS
jgi:hypothetical protein